MNTEQFGEILKFRLEQIQETLGNKAKEYAAGGDRLHNFKRAGQISDCTKEKALWGMLNKHLVSVIDMVEGKLKPTEFLINEKVGDLINYLVLLEACFKSNLLKEDPARIWKTIAIGSDGCIHRQPTSPPKKP